jgi:hypothetical protein
LVREPWSLPCRAGDSFNFGRAETILAVQVEWPGLYVLGGITEVSITVFIDNLGAQKVSI